MRENYNTKTGVRYPPGVNPDSDGVNFSIFSRHAKGVELLLYRHHDSPDPFQVISLESETNRTFFYWHVYVEELPADTWYAWRMDGPNDTRESGLRFDKAKNLVDPWARAVSHTLWDRLAASRPGDNGPTSMRARVVDLSYDWEDDQPLKLPSEQAIIYEMHVGGFTRHASSGVANPGTFAGVIEKIPYLQSLGITHVELLPVMAFDEQDVPDATANLGLKNYWGYSTHSFFSPHPGYCVTPERGTHLNEFRDMVKALHRAGIGVILDVVFNHTAESGTDGPCINFKGIDNNVFYHLDTWDKSIYRDYTGCGNTLNCNHPLVSMFIIGCLEYWVGMMHVDAFRFDLASILARGEEGEPVYNAPVLWGIELSDRLARTGVIAEAWDAAGLYQVGSFPGYRWAEWNGRYRDVVRRFLRGDKGLVGELASRITGSSDMYKYQGRLPINSINFITCHDGFTLYDLFSYSEKKNEANGENSRDGSNDNLSFNCGAEGETRDSQVLALRRQQAKNAFATLLLSQGVPMLLSGDEVLRTQRGNNNVYCQDNALSWFDWRLLQENADMLRFVGLMISLRKRHRSLMRRRFLDGEPTGDRELPDIVWHGKMVGTPLWDKTDARILSFTLAAIQEEEADLHIMLNFAEDDAEFELPPIGERTWCRTVDTALPSPQDIVEPEERSEYAGATYKVQARSVVVFEAPGSGTEREN